MLLKMGAAWNEPLDIRAAWRQVTGVPVVAVRSA
jgi:hypothetical protein